MRMFFAMIGAVVMSAGIFFRDLLPSDTNALLAIGGGWFVCMLGNMIVCAALLMHILKLKEEMDEHFRRISQMSNRQLLEEMDRKKSKNIFTTVTGLFGWHRRRHATLEEENTILKKERDEALAKLRLL